MLVSKQLLSHLHERLDILYEIPIDESVITLEWSGCDKRKLRDIINLVKSQQLFDLHWQYLEVSKRFTG